MSESNFERLVGKVLTDTDFAKKLQEANEKIKTADERRKKEGEREFREVLKSLEKEFGIEWSEEEIKKIIEATQTIDLKAMHRVAITIGADIGAN